MIFFDQFIASCREQTSISTFLLIINKNIIPILVLKELKYTKMYSKTWVNRSPSGRKTIAVKTVDLGFVNDLKIRPTWIGNLFTQGPGYSGVSVTPTLNTLCVQFYLYFLEQTVCDSNINIKHKIHHNFVNFKYTCNDWNAESFNVIVFLNKTSISELILLNL
jgi:hypothetical protein